ncbi:MAG: RsmB/NOP family class I SAM-dependent RNA methyltransferase [Alphaproteobacteria bacterium]|nr:MAG: RsmB/NOP family class I SAM-dependent RNA methyltransferase [Alphaproteobacteria bacterium]
MTPGARIAAAAALLDEILAGAPADRSLAAWGRANRFAGARDRAALADLVHDALRRRRSLAFRGGDSGRGLMLARAAERGELALFDGQGHAPAPPTAAELARLFRRETPPEAVALDVPEALEAELRRSLGVQFAAVMAALRRRAPLFLRANALKTSREAAIAALARDGVTAVPEAADPDALRVIDGARRVQHAAAYRAGLVEIQDLSSQRVARFAAARAGETVLDFCAGGGGKTLALAAHMGGRGRLLAHDAEPRRMEQLRLRAARAGVRVSLLAPDPPPQAADLVFVDAPCSGSGAWRRNPDAKWRLDTAGLARFCALQDRVLEAAAAHLAPGGRLVYATCSLLQAENEDRIAAFLDRHRRFGLGGTLRLTPLEGGDGFFAAMLHAPVG